MAKEARKHKLGPLHPAFSLLRSVQESMLSKLPEDAHVRASGKLCVSLTRVSDGKNILVPEFMEVWFTVRMSHLVRSKLLVLTDFRFSAIISSDIQKGADKEFADTVIKRF